MVGWLAAPRGFQVAGIGLAPSARAELPSASASSSPDPSAARLFVGGIPHGMTEAELWRIFDGVALPHEVQPVAEVVVLLRRDGSPRGYGFVPLAPPAPAQRARVLLNGRRVTCGGHARALVVRLADNFEPDMAAATRTVPLGGRCLWVGNVSWSTRASPMRAAFAAAGGVPAERVWCTLGSDGAGRATGFGTVRFPDAASAERALTAMQGTALDGRQLLVRLDRRAGVATASRLQKASRKMEAQLAELEGAADEIDPEVQGEIEATMLASEREELRLAQVQILIATPSVHRHGPSTARVPPPPPPRLPSITSVSASSQVARVRKVLTAVSAAATAEATARAKTAAAEQSTPRRSGAGRGGASSYTIVVFNVSYAAAPGAARRALYSAMAEASPALRRATYPDAQVRGPPTVRVAADRFGRCRGVATVAARSPAEALEVARALDGVELFGRTLAVRAQYGSRAAVLEMAAEMSGELGSKSGEPFSSSLGWLVERIADESADIAPAAAAVGPPRAEESAESSAYGKAW